MDRPRGTSEEGSHSYKGLAPSHSVLVVGGSGYLGQFIVSDLLKNGWTVGYTYKDSSVPGFEGEACQGFQVDLSTGAGLRECFDAMGQLARVINCASVSDLAVCEENPEYARAVNIPTRLLDELDRHVKVHGTQPWLVQISTDQVYDGASKLYKEWAGCRPVNVYGKSKLEGEKAVQQRWPRHIILRSSVLYGPPPPWPAKSKQLLQSIEGALAEKTPTSFPADEWRTPTYVKDMVRAINKACSRQDALPNRVLNLGGSERVSRADLAKAVAEAKGLDPSLVVPGSKGSGPSPADTSLDSFAAERDLGIKITPLKRALQEVFAS